MTASRRHMMLRVGQISALCLLLGACVAAPQTLQPGAARRAEGPSAHPVWPAPPATARIEFVQSIEKSADLGIGQSWVSRLKDWLLGEEELRLHRPSAVAVAAGSIYVSDPGLKGVHRFDLRQSKHELLRGPGGVALPSPVGLTPGPDQTVLITDSALGQVYVLGPDDRYAKVLALSVPLRQPTGIAYSASRQEIYVVDTQLHQLQVFSASGQWLRTIGQRGKGEGEFNFPTYITLSRDGNLVVTDALNFRIQVLRPTGEFVLAFGRQGDGTGDFGRHKGVAADQQGHLYVADGLFSAIQVFDSQGQFLLSIGSLGKAEGEFWLPMGMFMDQQRIYIADSANQRVQVLRYIEGAP